MQVLTTEEPQHTITTLKEEAKPEPVKKEVKAEVKSESEINHFPDYVIIGTAQLKVLLDYLCRMLQTIGVDIEDYFYQFGCCWEMLQLSNG